MEKVTIRDMYNLSKAANKPLLFDPDVTYTFPYLREYILDFEDFDRQIVRTMGLQYPIFNIEELSTAQNVWDEFRADCAAIVRRYNFNLDKVFKLISLEYNPLENYNRHEETTDDSSGSSTDTNNYGAKSDTENLGEVVSSNEFGELTKTDNNGAVNSTINYGATSRTEERGISGDNADDYVNSDNSRSSEAVHSDTSLTEAVENTSTTAAHTDTNRQNAVVNQRTSAEHEDVLEGEHHETAKRISDISGNIGVMSTQQMFEQEWSIIKNYNPYDVLLKLISNDLLVLFSQGYSAMNTTLQNELLLL